MRFNVFKKSVSKVRNLKLPGQTAQFKMAPPFRTELLALQKEKMKHAKQAAILALFYPNAEDKTHLALILRKSYKGVHSAQIGFPGGKVEDEDVSLKITALRETEEEIGVPSKDIEVLKQLTEVYIPPSNFTVFPFMGTVSYTPKFIEQEDEVEAVIEVSLNDLLDEALVGSKVVRTSYSPKVEVPVFNFNGHTVWGATAMMLSEVKELLKQVI